MRTTSPSDSRHDSTVGGPSGVPGTRYLDAVRDGERNDPALVEAVWLGKDLGDEVHLAFVLGALDGADGDDDLWLIGEQPVEEGLAVRPGMIARLRGLRAENGQVERLWLVMQRYHAEVRDDLSTFWYEFD